MKQTELQKILGERIEKLNQDDLTDDEFMREVSKAKNTAALAKEMVRNARLILDAKISIGALRTEDVNELV